MRQQTIFVFWLEVIYKMSSPTGSKKVKHDVESDNLKQMKSQRIWLINEKNKILKSNELGKPKRPYTPQHKENYCKSMIKIFLKMRKFKEIANYEKSDWMKKSIYSLIIHELTLKFQE